MLLRLLLLLRVLAPLLQLLLNDEAFTRRTSYAHMLNDDVLVFSQHRLRTRALPRHPAQGTWQHRMHCRL
ncbi:hypothetical protein N9L68_08610 [bacterium]|nr:hypothetical protein [bacterium]